MLAKYIDNLANNKEIYLKVKIIPGRAKTEFLSPMADGTLKIAVAAIPEKGEANQELIKFLASELGVRKYQVQITAGASGRDKLVKVSR